MSPVDYHAWTHRPKSKGGTDPIAFSTLPYCYMRWIGSEAVPANTLSNPATVGTPDAPYEEGFIFDPDGLAGFGFDLTTGIIDVDELGLYYVHATAEWNGTGSAGETLGVVLDKGSSGSFSDDRTHNSITADAVNQNMAIPVSRFYFQGFNTSSFRVQVYHTDAGGNDIGAVWIHIVQLNADVDGEFFIPS